MNRRDVIIGSSLVVGSVVEYPCGGCGGPHEYDTSVPSPLWNRVVREQGLSDYLCASCIVKVFARARTSFTAELYGPELDGPQVPHISVQINETPIDDSYGCLQARIRELEEELKAAQEEARSARRGLPRLTVLHRCIANCIANLNFQKSEPVKPCDRFACANLLELMTREAMAETGGWKLEMALPRKGRPLVYSLYGCCGCEVTRIDDVWQYNLRPLNVSERKSFKAEYGNQAELLLTLKIGNLEIRGFVLNGRSEGWNLSTKSIKSDV